MTFIADPTRFPDESFHTVSVKEEDDGSYYVAANNNETHCIATVDSVAIGDEAVGLEAGDLRFGAAAKNMRLTYTDFEEHGYDELQITFEDR